MTYGPIIIYKRIGETPLEAMEKARFNHPEWGKLPMTYAGRLDPVAEGLLLVLVGEDCKEKDKYLDLNKEYELSVLFGFETDTYDLLGRVMGVEISKPTVDRSVLDQTLKKFTGEVVQDYPPYSSKPVDGKPLFQIAREGGLAEIEIPKHKVKISKIDILEEKTISKDDLLRHIRSVVSSVDGDFRQEEILTDWDRFIGESEITEFPIIKILVSCGSGAYMRTIAHELGKVLGIKSLAYHIKRTKIGEYDIKSVK